MCYSAFNDYYSASVKIVNNRTISGKFIVLERRMNQKKQEKTTFNHNGNYFCGLWVVLAVCLSV